ncbi:kinase-like domain-containing protein [Aspergillus venezuelensis]
MAALDPAIGYVIKFHLGDDDERERCEKERDVCEQLGKSKLELLKFYGTTEHGILLDYAEHGPVREFLRQCPRPIAKTILIKWARQATEALKFIQANGIYHGEVNCTNFFVDSNLNLKLGDFTSSANDSSVTVENLREDILSLGGALYEMKTGHLSFPDLEEDEREQRLEAGEFPDVSGFILESVILHCWNESEFSEVPTAIDVAGRDIP